MARGIVPQDLADAASAAGKPLAGGKQAFNYFAEALPTGSHWKPEVATFSPSDVEVLKKIGGHLGFAGNVIDASVGLYEWRTGTPGLEVLSKTGGSMAGAMALGAVGAQFGLVAGPPGAFAGAFILGTAGAIGGEEAGERIYRWLAGN